MIIGEWTVENSNLEGHFKIVKRTVLEVSLSTPCGSESCFVEFKEAQDTANKLNSGELLPARPQDRI